MVQPILLNDEQMRRFIVDGYLVLKPNLPAELHKRVYDRLDRVIRKEGNPGNNILPAVPELQALLDSPEVCGAMQSVLGRGYILHPHRFTHNNEPRAMTDSEGQAGAGSALFVGWHQDSHSPLGRPRHHRCRYAMLLYYPQDTPPEMGPTQLIPGSQYSDSLSAEAKETGHIVPGEAGTCVLVHFDIGHGGSLNVSDKTRYMVKWVFTRIEEPAEPTWNFNDGAPFWPEDISDLVWRKPEIYEASEEHALIWDSHWNWLTGGPSSNSELGAADKKILYDSHPRSQWNEDAIVMETSAFDAIEQGENAINDLLEELASEDEWRRINAIFALGEMGREALPTIPILRKILNENSHPIVRTALDAIGQICCGSNESFSEIYELLKKSDPEWEKPLRRGWCGRDQVRVNAVTALLRIGDRSNEAEAVVIEALNDSCGYVGGFGVEYLLRLGTPNALKASIAYLQAHRWDDSLMRGVRTF